MICFPFAKINLGLNVINKRSDGYHNLDTVFYPIFSFYDVLEIIPSNEYFLKIYNSPEIIPTEKNLVTKAYKLLQKDYNIDPVEVHLIKKIPSKAGLGGGSSDAAHMLLLLNKFFNLNISFEKLAEYSLLIGSDCPFFLHDKPMIGRARGNELSPFDINLSNRFIAIVLPLKNNSPIEISTKEAFSNIVPKSNRLSPDAIISEQPDNQWRNNLTNDFLDSVKIKFPEIPQTINALYSIGAKYASLSGSGSACFAIFHDKSFLQHNLFPLCKTVFFGTLTPEK